MDQSVVDRFRELENRLAERFPEARKEAEALALGIANPRTVNADAIWSHAWNKPLFANTRVANGTAMIQKLSRKTLRLLQPRAAALRR